LALLSAFDLDAARAEEAGDGVAQVAVGYAHSCALVQSGDVYCWGMETVNGQVTSSALARLCCTNTVRDSSCESSVIAGGHEQTELTDLQDAELARV
jgi:alpha-tubulin suppressor-like RCC1 family protein